MAVTHKTSPVPPPKNRPAKAKKQTMQQMVDEATAATLGISQETYASIMNSKAPASEDDIRIQTVIQTRAKLRYGASLAADLLVSILEDKSATPELKVAAASALVGSFNVLDENAFI